MKRFLLLMVLLVGGCAAARAQDAGAGVGEPGPDQPIPFSHKKHVQVAKAACADCHVPTKSGASLVMPQAGTCMLCHSAIATDKPDIQRLAAIAKSGEPIPWVRVYQVPSFVQFSHKVHTAGGKICQECHGPVGERDVIAKETDISMAGCIACHTKNNAPTTCDTCHQLEARNVRPHADPDALLLARLGLVHPPLPSSGTWNSSTPPTAGWLGLTGLSKTWAHGSASQSGTVSKSACALPGCAAESRRTIAAEAGTSTIRGYLGTLAMLPRRP